MAAAAKALPPADNSLAAVSLRAFSLSRRDWTWAVRHQNGLQQRCRELFKAVDVVLCPPMPTVALPHDHSSDLEARRLDIDGKEVRYRDQIVWASLATVAGLPATVAPIGHSPEGLPVGVQIVGPYLEDRTTIAFAGLIEREFGGFAPPPAG
jgi:amidase